MHRIRQALLVSVFGFVSDTASDTICQTKKTQTNRKTTLLLILFAKLKKHKTNSERVMLSCLHRICGYHWVVKNISKYFDKSIFLYILYHHHYWQGQWIMTREPDKDIVRNAFFMSTYIQVPAFRAQISLCVKITRPTLTASTPIASKSFLSQHFEFLSGINIIVKGWVSSMTSSVSKAWVRIWKRTSKLQKSAKWGFGWTEIWGRLIPICWQALQKHEVDAKKGNRCKKWPKTKNRAWKGFKLTNVTKITTRFKWWKRMPPKLKDYTHFSHFFKYSHPSWISFDPAHVQVLHSGSHWLRVWGSLVLRIPFPF